jgi:quinol monooxygenase YgiN
MAIGVTAKLHIIEGKNKEFEAVVKQLASAVIDNEKGCLLYAFHQSRDDAQTYIILEQYANELALQEHTKTEHYLRLGSALAQFLAASPQIELMDTI